MTGNVAGSNGHGADAVLILKKSVTMVMAEMLEIAVMVLVLFREGIELRWVEQILVAATGNWWVVQLRTKPRMEEQAMVNEHVAAGATDDFLSIDAVVVEVLSLGLQLQGIEVAGKNDSTEKAWVLICVSVCQVIAGTIQMQWLGSGGKLNSVLQKQWLNGWSQVERVGLFCSCICKYRWAPAGYGVGLAG
ncbi:hypothetical protein C5167_045332, partial [Papaver somniferum]